MDLQTATRLSGVEGRAARLIALVCFGIACGFLAASLTDHGGGMGSTPVTTSSVAR